MHHKQGYVLVEYSTLDEARGAIDGANGKKLLDQTIEVDFAFVRPPPGKQGQGQGQQGQHGQQGQQGRGLARGAPPKTGRARSRSPREERGRADDES